MIRNALRRIRRRFFGRKRPKTRMIVLIDLENILTNTQFLPPEKFSQMAGLNNIVKRIAREIGEVAEVYVFTPYQLALTWGEALYQQGFVIIYCPKIRTKKGEETDTVDSVLIEVGEKMMNWIPGVTHFCLGSGDQDFTPLLRKAIRKGLKIAIIAGSLSSLSSQLIPLVDRNKKGEKMIYIFSPTEE